MAFTIGRIPEDELDELLSRLDPEGVSWIDHQDSAWEEVELLPGVVLCNGSEDEIVVAEIALGDRPAFLVFPVESEDEVIAMAPGVEIGVAPIVAAAAKAVMAIVPTVVTAVRNRRERKGKGTVVEEWRKRRAAKGKGTLLEEWRKRRMARRNGEDRMPILDRFRSGRASSVEAPVPPPGWAWVAAREEDVNEAAEEVLAGYEDELGNVPWDAVAKTAMKAGQVIATGARKASGSIREGGTAMLAKAEQTGALDAAQERLASPEGQGRLRDAFSRARERGQARRAARRAGREASGGRLKLRERFSKLFSRKERLAARAAQQNQAAGNTMLLPELPEGFVWVMRESLAPMVAGAEVGLAVELGCAPGRRRRRSARGGNASRERFHHPEPEPPLPGPFELRGQRAHLEARGRGMFDDSPEVQGVEVGAVDLDLYDTDGTHHDLVTGRSGPRRRFK